MSIFEEVKSQLTIRQVLEGYGVKVNRARQFICPFHNDHKPSAGIKDDYFHCFVCGAGGDLITFTARYFGLKNFDAAKKLIEDFGLDVQLAEPKADKVEKAIRQEVRSCSGLREKIKKDSQLRAEKRAPKMYKLRGEVRQQNRKKEAETESYIMHAGLVLADMHRVLWQGVQLYPVVDERHIRGLQGLTICQYYLDCYNDNPLQFCLDNYKVVEEYERRLELWGG